MATPPKGRKMAPERPFPILIETGKSDPKTGLLPVVRRRFCRRFADSFPAVFRRFSGGFPGGFAGGFPATRFPWINPQPAPAPHLKSASPATTPIL